jgi:hypothetical protein
MLHGSIKPNAGSRFSRNAKSAAPPFSAPKIPSPRSRFVDAYNAESRPFVWTATSEAILEKVA